MSLNLYNLIIKTANEMKQDITLEEIGIINNTINELLSRGINKYWIENNLECLF